MEQLTNKLLELGYLLDSHQCNRFFNNISIIDSKSLYFARVLSFTPMIGLNKNIYSLAFCMDEKGTWLLFEYIDDNLENNTLYHIRVDISPTGNSVNMAIEEILSIIYSKSDLVYDYVYKEVDGHQKKLFNRLKKDINQNNLLNEFIYLAHLLNDAHKEFIND